MPAEFKTVESLFLRALECNDNLGQQKFLDRECSGDAKLRQQVEALLLAHDRADSFLDEPLVSAVKGGFAPNGALKKGGLVANVALAGETKEGSDADEENIFAFLSPSERPESLGRLDNYEVLEHLGSGGFGIVLKAFDETLQRIVALKVIAPSIAVTSPARKRFLREARSSAAVCHENVVRIHAVEERPLPYLIMEFVPGETLQERLDRAGPFDLTEILSIGRQVAQGLAAAHETGLIHRDIKPGNILIESGPVPRVKITDFGLARAADDASLTQSGIVAGTPMYMAPEQANGEPLDHRADLFSLGSVLYVACTGRPPFRASSPMAVLKRVCEDQPRPIRETIAEIPEAVVQIVERLHQKDPGKRFQTAQEVAQTLATLEAELLETGKLRDLPKLSIASAVRSPRSVRGKWVAGAAFALCLCSLIVFIAARQASGWYSQQTLVEAPAQTSIPEPWEKIDPLDDCNIRWENGGPTFTVPGDGRHLFDPLGPKSDQNGPRLLREVSGDFEAMVTVVASADEGSAAESSGTRSAGLMVWADEGDRVARLTVSGSQSVKAEWFFGGKLHGEKSLNLASDPVHLKIQKKEGGLRFFSSTDKQAWTWIESAPDFTFGAPVKVGATAANLSKREFTARLPDLMIDLRGDTQEKELPQKWVSLFNGKDLTGWQALTGHPTRTSHINAAGQTEWQTLPGKKLGEWRVEKGVLIGKGKLGCLFYTAPFENFHFRAEMQINSTGSGGVYVRAPNRHPDDIPDSKDCGTLVRGMDTATFQDFGPSTFSTSSMSWVRIRGATWMLIELIANGSHMMVKYGGGPAPVGQLAKRDFGPGQIALQVWDAETEVRFQNIEIMELPKLAKDHRLARPDAINPSQYYGSLMDVVRTKLAILEADKTRFKDGKISGRKLIWTECDLAESQMQYALSRYRHDEFAESLTDLLELREKEYLLVSKRVEAGLEPRKNADQVAHLVAETKARLAKAGGPKKREQPVYATPKKD